MKNGFLIFLVILSFLSCKINSSNYILSTKSFSEKSLNGNLCAILINQTTNNKIYFQKDECFYKTPPSSLFHPVLAFISVEGGYLKENQTLFSGIKLDTLIFVGKKIKI